MTSRSPPGWAFRLLGILLPRTIREPVLGDLAESYCRRARERGPREARRWLRHEAWRLARTLGSYSDDRVPLTPPRPPWQGLGTDLRIALRRLARRPGFVAVAVFTLTLGIGGNAAIFSLVKPILLQGLPWPEGGRLVSIRERENHGASDRMGYATLADLRGGTRALDRLAAAGSWAPVLMGQAEPEQLVGQKVTAEFFSTLGVRPALGRDFRPEDDRPGVDRVTILSYGLWRSRFGADPGLVGRAVSLDGYPFTVIGILPPEFESLLEPRAALWMPLRYDPSLPWACRTCRHLTPIGRLAPGADFRAAEQELTVLADRLAQQFPDAYPGKGVAVEPLASELTRSARAPLWSLMAAVGLVLLLACVNVANLLLGQATERAREFAVRVALGSPRSRIVRQLLVESSVIGLLGATLGAGLAVVLLRLVRTFGPEKLPRLGAASVDWVVLGFTALAGLVAGLAFGIGPALAATSHALPAGRLVGGRPRRLVRNGLVVAELALALTLVIGAGLLYRSMDRLLGVDPGFRPDRLVTMDLGLSGRRFDSAAALGYYREVVSVARGTPGVESAGLVSQLPLGGGLDGYSVAIESKPGVPDPERPAADRYSVTGSYFAAMGIPLVAGRLFTEADRGDAAPVVLVNEAMARLEWPGRSPIGDRIQLGGEDAPWRTVVGVVGDVRNQALDQPVTRQVYLPEEQWLFVDSYITLVARTTLPPDQVGPALRQRIRAIDPNATIARLGSMEAVISRSIASRRFVMVLFQAFALVALVLAAAGVYGVTASGVVERFREFGIRSALGASRGRLLRLVLGEALGLGILGALAGIAGAAALARLVRSLLFGVGSSDPWTYLGAALLLALVLVAAAWAPARRAAALDPAVSLRGD